MIEVASDLSISATAIAFSADGDRPGPSSPVAQTIGRYTILQKIGSGGMGVVYSAYDPKLDRRVAIKALHAATDPERDTAGRSRLVREAKAMARLSHPNVVTVYDVLAEDRASRSWPMELVEEQSLRAWLGGERRGLGRR